MEFDIWKQTYRRDHVDGLYDVTLMTVISEHPGEQRTLVARMEVSSHSPDFNAQVSALVKMTPKQMRELAALLNTHADRIEQELIPLLAPEPEIIPFQLYHEPEAA